MKYLICLLFISCLFHSCENASESGREYPVAVLPEWDGKRPFEPLAPATSGIDFANELSFNPDFNIFTYRNYYNGGGVAIGDVNNDGLADLYFTGNLVDNELYLNQGELTFESITETAGVAGQGGWSTGVSMADVNGDGWLDIYVCNSGELDGDNKQNELFINNQDGTFTEAAESWGIADRGYGTHGVFFDYDRDGDLDLYLLNNSYQAIGSFNLQKNERPKRDPIGGDKLFRNELISENGTAKNSFTDVSEAAGIYGSVIGFGLGVTVGDIDRDGWQDIYVSNDFFERDYLYHNQGDGTFKEVLTDRMQSISVASMGADMADLTNDGFPEIFVTEMLPQPNERIKTATTFENWNRYQYNLKNDYYHQFTRNTLQRNNRDGTFSEIGRLNGVEATDWSWGALIFDMDNDGNKDLFVANGIYQDLTNRDFLDFLGASETKKAIITKEGVDYRALVDAIPTNPVPNYAYRNLGAEGDYRFEDVSEAFGLDWKWFSNGSAYGDLDNDGDLDLVLNNTNAPALIYRNHHNESEHKTNWIQFKLEGESPNTAAIGSQLSLMAGGNIQYLEMMPMRGFESTVDGVLHFGLGTAKEIESLVVRWPDGVESIYNDLDINQRHLLKIEARPAALLSQENGNPATLLDLINKSEQLVEKSKPESYGLDFVHRENQYSDFDRDPLIYHMASAESPKMCTGDFNGDGQLDFYIGGARGQAGKLYYYSGGSYRSVSEVVFEKDKDSEDSQCACFDADGDGDLDLYVGSGSSEFSGTNAKLLDRLYLNENNGSKWTKSPQLLPNPSRPINSSVVINYDVDQDGDQDLFVGGRMIPGVYGAKADSYLLLNDGAGVFTPADSEVLKNLGMVTDAVFTDLDQDGQIELIVVGEWMEPRVFSFRNGGLEQGTVALPAALGGWYNTITAGNLNGDDYPDLVLGNHGLNSRFRASAEGPIRLHLNDFDGNGRAEPIISAYQDGKAYPLALLHDLNKQIPGLRKKYLKYESYGDQGIEDIFEPEVLARSEVSEVEELRSMVLLNRGGQFTAQALPIAAQESPLFAVVVYDVDQDGDQDLITGGNFYYAKPEAGRYDADRGNILLNDGNGQFSAAQNSGLKIAGEVRDLAIVPAGGAQLLLVAKNNAPMEIYRLLQ